MALWVRGQGHLAALTSHAVTIAGSYGSTRYGDHVAGQFADDLAGRGWSVVAAGGYGIGTAALTAAAPTTTPAIAVTAFTGDLRNHRLLFADVACRGVVVCAGPPAGPSSRRRFLDRQQLLAALARAVVIVEAGTGSEALLAARTARLLGRPVMAVPSPVTAATSAGCHLLLRAQPHTRLVTTGQDILGVLNPPAPTPLCRIRILVDFDPNGRRHAPVRATSTKSVCS